jgi:hypothetical protein
MQIQTQDWVKNAIFYQIFPDRFARSKQPRRRLLQNFLWEQWHEIPTLQGYKGRDLWGVEKELIVAVNVGTATTKVSFNTANIKSHPDQILYGSGDVSWNIEGETNQLELSISPRTGLILGATN